jgi:hypothetical protein
MVDRPLEFSMDSAFFKVPPDHYKTHGVQGSENTIQPWRVAGDGSVHNAI